MIAGQILEYVLYAFIVLLWIRFLTGWVVAFARQWEPKGIVLVVLEGAYTATDPPINAIGRFAKPIRIGPWMLDLAFMIVLILAYIALALNRTFLL